MLLSDFRWVFDTFSIHQWLPSDEFAPEVMNKFDSLFRGRGFHTWASKMSWAAKKGYLSYVKWASKQCDIDVKYLWGLIASDAAENGHYEVVMWLRENVGTNDEVFSVKFDEFVFIGATRGGHVHILKQYCPELKWAPVAYACMVQEAALLGNVEVLRFLVGKISRVQSTFMNVKYLMCKIIMASASRGHVNVLDYFLSSCSNDDDPVLITTKLEAISEAFENKHFAFVVRAIETASSKERIGICLTVSHMFALSQEFQEYVFVNDCDYVLRIALVFYNPDEEDFDRLMKIGTDANSRKILALWRTL